MDPLAAAAADLHEGQLVRLVFDDGTEIEGEVRFSSTELIELKDQPVRVNRLRDILIEMSPGGIE